MYLLTLTESGRNFICNSICRILEKTQGVELSIDNWDGKFVNECNLKGIHLKQKNKSDVFIEKISFKNIHWFTSERVDINIGNFKFETFTKSQNKLEAIREAYRITVSSLVILHTYVNKIVLTGNGVIKNPSNEQVLESLKYSSEKSESDSRKYSLSFVLDKSKSISKETSQITFTENRNTKSIEFTNICDYSGEAKYERIDSNLFKVSTKLRQKDSELLELFGTYNIKLKSSGILNCNGTILKETVSFDIKASEKKKKFSLEIFNIKNDKLSEALKTFTKSDLKDFGLCFECDENLFDEFSFFVKDFRANSEKSKDQTLAEFNVKTAKDVEIISDKIETMFLVKNKKISLECDNFYLKIYNNFSKAELKAKSGVTSLTSNLSLQNHDLYLDNLIIKNSNFEIKNLARINVFNKESAKEFEICCEDVSCVSDFLNLNKQDIHGKCILDLKILNSKLNVILKSKAGINYKSASIFDAKLYVCGDDFEGKIEKIKLGNFEIKNVDFNCKKGSFFVTTKLNEKEDFNLAGQFLKEDSKYSLKFSKIDLKSLNILSDNLLLTYAHLNDALSLNSSKTKFGEHGNIILDMLIQKDNLSLNVDFKNIAVDKLVKLKNLKKNKLFDGLTVEGKCNLHGALSAITGTFDLGLFKNKTNNILSLKWNAADSYFLCALTYNDNGNYVLGNIKLPGKFSLKDFKLVDSSLKDVFIDIKTSADLQKILFLPDDMTVKGKCVSEILIKGHKNSPTIKANLKISQGLFEGAGVIFPNINAELFSDDLNKVHIKVFEAKDSDGNKFSITGSGKVVFNEGIPNLDCDLKVKTKNYLLMNTDTINAIVTGTGTGTGLLGDLNVKGNLDAKITYNIPNDNGNFSLYENIIIHDSKKHFVPKETEKLDTPYKPLFNFDVDLNCKNLEVIGDSIESNFIGKTKLITFDERLSLDGELKLKSGYLSFINKRLAIRNGSLKFRKENGLVPKVDILAQSNFKDLLLSVKIVSDENLKPKIDIFSNPKHRMDQILSKVLFGRPSQELRLSEATKIQEAVKNIKQQSNDAFSILDQIKKLMFVDISLEQDINETTREESYSLKAGAYVNDKIYIGVKKNLEKESASCNVKIDISPQVSLEGDSNGDVGISWFRRY